MYIASHEIEKLPATLEVDGMMSQIFKPRVLTKCKHCGQTGHQPGNTKCLAKAPDAIMDEVEAFRGLGNPLSNLHICEHSCEIKDKGISFLLSKHYYQYKKLQLHDLGEESVHLVMETDPFKVMNQANELLPDDKISNNWSRVACDKMLVTNQLKYDSCEHARDLLLDLCTDHC